MARDIADFTGTVIAPGGSYPYGRIKNNPAGTRVNEQMLGDVIQFHQKAMAEAGVTPNGLPDNSSDGFQLYQAFATLAGRDAWGAIPTSGAGSTTYTAVGGGSITVNAVDRTYESIRIVGKTLYYGNRVTLATITGTVSSINMNITTLGGTFTFKHAGLPIMAWRDQLNTDTFAILNAAPAHLTLVHAPGGVVTNFPTGAMSFDINLVAEFDV